jgi:UDP-N-acetyl-D-glucosamine dehydrogenase
LDAKEFIKKVEERSLVVGIAGIGYVGLPLALAFSEKGFRVVGFDVDGKKVEAVNAGRSYISYIPEARIAAAVANGLKATADFSLVPSCDAVLICVPTPLSRNREPDLSYVAGTAEDIAPFVRAGQLICL